MTTNDSQRSLTFSWTFLNSKSAKKHEGQLKTMFLLMDKVHGSQPGWMVEGTIARVDNTVTFTLLERPRHWSDDSAQTSFWPNWVEGEEVPF